MMLTGVQFKEYEEKVRVSKISDVFVITRGLLSISNEYYVLKAIAAIARIRLVGYDHSLKENVEVLLDESMPMFTNSRNTVVYVGVRRWDEE